MSTKRIRVATEWANKLITAPSGGLFFARCPNKDSVGLDDTLLGWQREGEIGWKRFAAQPKSVKLMALAFAATAPKEFR